MNKKAENFKKYLDEKEIKAFTVDEIKDDQFQTVVFRSAADINGNRLHDVQKYVVMTKHIYDTAPLLASKIWWDGLSAADQELIMSTYAETVALQRQISFDDQETIKKAIGGNGTNVVVELTAEEAAAWRTAVQPVYDKYQSTLNQEWLAKIDEINAKY